MSLNRLLKYINLSVATALVVAFFCLYWYALRPLPKTSGSIPAFISKPVTVARDHLGTPHISAANLDDALFVQGYVTAQDRLWQMDLLRRLAGGEIAEIFGPIAAESDREARRLRVPRLAESASDSIPPADRAALAAYARGVNAYIETHRNRLPVEFLLLGYGPRPWRVADSIRIGLHMFRTLTTTWKDEILKRNLLAGGDPEKVNFLFPVRTGAEAQPGSNAWAIAGRLTASGRPLLANDMHLEFSVPGIWHQVHIQAPGLNVAGVCLPGVPGVIVGHNDRIAWGITNLQFDVQDLYVEQFDDNTGRYVFRGKTEQARPERELILVKGAAPLELINWVTNHGPIFVRDGKDRMSLRWIAAEAGAFQFPFLDIDRARNWQEFIAGVARFPGPGSNIVYADVDGNIGYHVAGKLPIRKTYLGDLPVDGASGKFEWQGFIPFEQLPSAFNPPSGAIVTANQNPFPADYPYAVSGNFAAPYRSSQIRALLSAARGWRPEDMLRVQKDVYSPFSDLLARELVRAYDARHATSPDLSDPIALLRGWNGQMEKSDAAPLIATLAFQHVRKAAGERASPGKGSLYDLQMAPAALEKLLRTRPPGWFPDYDEMLLRALIDAVEEGKRIQGRDVKKWIYGKYNEAAIRHPVGHGLPLIGNWFDIGPVEMSGSATTVKQTTRRLAPSMRMTVDFSDWDRSLLNLQIGESGQMGAAILEKVSLGIFDGHYRDQWQHYYTGQSFRMQFQKPEARQTLTFVPAM